MSALYRQARPTTFDEMVGQEHVKEVLYAALAQNKLAQAYMFSGPRGVGKTSSARLIAQAVNCSAEKKPCGVCEGCRLVREGRHPDVLEIDAASNNSVEDVRDLRERILLSPIIGDKKVVILDEAHMMSKSAFNALLKTLEEPPEHVIFIFATTEPERMPPTILSRTQHFKFKRLSVSEIVEKLERIIKSIDRNAEPAALQLVGKLADGAMRDAESLLDRLLTIEGDITLKQTEAALGLAPQEALFGVVEALDSKNVKEALDQVGNLYTQGYAARTLAQALLEAFREGLYAKMGIGSGPNISSSEEKIVGAMTALDESMDRLQKRSDALSLELAVLSAYQAMHGRAMPETVVQAAPVSAPAPTPSRLPDFDTRPRRPEPTQSTPRAAGSPAEATPVAQPQSSSADADIAQDWRLVLNQLRPTIRAFYREATPYLEGERLTLLFSEDKTFHFESAKKYPAEIQKAVDEILGKFQVEIKLGGKKKVVESAPVSPPPSFPVPKVEKPISEPTVEAPLVPVETPRVAKIDEEQPEPTQPPAYIHEPSGGTIADGFTEFSPEEDWVPQDREYSGEEPATLDNLPKVAIATDSILGDPRFKNVMQMFGGRLKKVHRNTPKELEDELSESDLTDLHVEDEN